MGCGGEQTILPTTDQARRCASLRLLEQADCSDGTRAAVMADTNLLLLRIGGAQPAGAPPPLASGHVENRALAPPRGWHGSLRRVTWPAEDGLSAGRSPFELAWVWFARAHYRSTMSKLSERAIDCPSYTTRPRLAWPNCDDRPFRQLASPASDDFLGPYTIGAPFSPR